MGKEQVHDNPGSTLDPHNTARPTHLTLFQRWFCKPVEEDQGKQSELPQHEKDAQPTPQSPERKFSLLAKGSLIAEGLLIIMLIAVLAVALAVTLTAKSNSLPGHSGNTPFPPSNDQPGNLAYAFSKPPIRLGVLTNFPDPSIWHDGEKWWAYGTNDAAGILNRRKGTVDPKEFSRSNIQIASSTDFKRWNLMNSSADPLPDPGVWVKRADKGVHKSSVHGGGKDGEADLAKGDDKERNGGNRPDESIKRLVGLANVWAPDILQHPKTGKWLLYYTAATKDGPHCIGVATASTPAGPFTPGPQPLMCPKEQGGAIDPVAFVDESDDDAIYVAYKIDGNARGHGGECGNTKRPIHSTPIMLQKMSADGTEIDRSFDAVMILDRDPEDGPLVEAPSIVKVGGTYFLFYSGGCTRSPSYNIRYATAPRLTGPYTRHSGPPLLKTGDHGMLAPGSMSVRWAKSHGASENIRPASDTAAGKSPSSKGHWKIALHGRVPTGIGRVRAMFTSAIEFDGDKVKLVDDPESEV